ncbi:MAG: prepilin peptidase, partial [Myxococcota bacterium]
MREVLANYPVPFPVLMGLLGALVGSFLNVVILRLPEGKSIVYPPSSCPKCGDRIPPWLNIPILSWLVLRGRCRACKTPISVRYPLIELLTTLLFVAVARRFGIEPATVAGVILVSGLIVITFIDIDYFEIPDEISIWGTLVGCLIRPWAFDVPWWSGLVGAALGG